MLKNIQHCKYGRNMYCAIENNSKVQLGVPAKLVKLDCTESVSNILIFISFSFSLKPLVSMITFPGVKTVIAIRLARHQCNAIFKMVAAHVPRMQHHLNVIFVLMVYGVFPHCLARVRPSLTSSCY